MAGPIAFCENPTCGAIFPFQNFIGGAGNANISFTNSRVGPCPRCGSMGKIPDGVYNYSGEVLSILRSDEFDVSLLRQFEQILRGAKVRSANAEEVKAQLERDLPQAVAALQLLPAGKDILPWLTFLIALVGLAIQIHLGYFKDNGSNIDQEVHDRLLKEGGSVNSPSVEPKQKKRKVGRNEPCPCGSGKKAKKCCGYGWV